MIDVQQYDVFFTEFRKIIGEIEKQKNNEDILLVNMASGTPGNEKCSPGYGNIS